MITTPYDEYLFRIFEMMDEYGLSFKTAVEWDMGGFACSNVKTKENIERYFLLNFLSESEAHGLTLLYTSETDWALYK